LRRTAWIALLLLAAAVGCSSKPGHPAQQAQGAMEKSHGVFQILRKDTRTGEFAFHGWRADTQKRWREVIEVDAGSGGDIERAMVRRMIDLIRSHYTGDFRWESSYLGRVVVLSARPEDQAALEAFLMREFFGTLVDKDPADRAQVK
jgi:hypothetical protein